MIELWIHFSCLLRMFWSLKVALRAFPGGEGEGHDQDRQEVHREEAVEGPQERALLPPEDAEAGAEADVPTGLPFPQLRLRRG